MRVAFGITAQQKQLLSSLAAGEMLSTSLFKVADALKNLDFGQGNIGMLLMSSWHHGLQPLWKFVNKILM